MNSISYGKATDAEKTAVMLRLAALPDTHWPTERKEEVTDGEEMQVP